MRKELDKELERMQEILREHGIVMAVMGCGCCGSPGVYFEYKGERIIFSDKYAEGTVDYCSFDMRQETGDQT